MQYELSPLQWFVERELKFRPKHFVVTSTPITEESYYWILTTLKGRFSVENKADTALKQLLELFEDSRVPAFEDPQEAVIYELRWS